MLGGNFHSLWLILKSLSLARACNKRHISCQIQTCSNQFNPGLRHPITRQERHQSFPGNQISRHFLLLLKFLGFNLEEIVKPNFDASTDQTLESTKVGTVKRIDTLMLVFTFIYEGL